jgi:multicomponent K+:H+ antiporter subunit D
MTGWIDHLIIVPVVLPLLAGASMLMIEERRRTLKAGINLASTIILIAVAVTLLRLVDGPGADGSASKIGVYLLGNWPASFGIVLVLDRLSALMLVLTAVLALASLLFALARWHHAGIYFHPLFQFLIMGLNGAFLTGDLFNLFVFFEVLLAASYGLVLHGSGSRRVRAGLHYIVVNLAASFLFLIGVSLIYGTTGTLNMADLAARIPALAPEDEALFRAGAAVLWVAFLVKAAMWPLGFWLPSTYAASSPPVAAFFAIMSKVGVYAVLRVWLLIGGSEGASTLGDEWLFYGGIMTIVFGSIGVLASQDMARLAGFSVLVSSGTLLAVIGVNDADVTAGALFYLASSTLALGAFFLLIELVERGREVGADLLAVTREAFGDPEEEILDEDEQVGMPIPATMAVLGVSFVCCALILIGLPPLSGFIGKFALLTGIFASDASGGSGAGPAAWALLIMILWSGWATLIGMTRAGIRSFWTEDREVPRVGIIEMAPIVVLLGLCLALTVEAGPVMRYMETTATALHLPATYIEEVLSAPPVVAPETMSGR